MSIDTAIKRLRKLCDNPNPHPDDVQLDVAFTIYRLLEVKERAEAAEADARRYRFLRSATTGKAVNATTPGPFAAWLNGPELDAAIDAELAKEKGR
jgi:hypothetical protein